MTTLLIEKDLAQDILNYLAARPYGEVYGLVDRLCNLSPVIPPVDEPAVG